MAYLMGQDSKLAGSPALMKETLTSASILKTKLPQGAGSPPDLGLLLNNGAGGQASSKLVNTTTKSNSQQRADITSSAWVPTFPDQTGSAR